MSIYQKICESIPEENIVYSEFAQFIATLMDKKVHTSDDFKQLSKFPTSYLNHYVENYGDELSEEELLQLTKIIRRYKTYNLFKIDILPEWLVSDINFHDAFSREIQIVTAQTIDFKSLLGQIQALLKKFKPHKRKPIFQSLIKSKILSLAFQMPKGNKNPPALSFFECSFIRRIIIKLENYFEEERFTESFSTRRLALY